MNTHEAYKYEREWNLVKSMKDSRIKGNSFDEWLAIYNKEIDPDFTPCSQSSTFEDIYYNVNPENS